MPCQLQENVLQRTVADELLRLFTGCDPTALDGPLTTWIPRVFFLLLPLYALLLALFYVRQRKQYFFVDHLVFSLVIHSFLFAMLIVAVGAAQLLSGGLVALLIFLAISTYIFLALKRFYKQGWFITSVKFACISFIYSYIVACIEACIAASASDRSVDILGSYRVGRCTGPVGVKGYFNVTWYHRSYRGSYKTR